MNFTKKEMKRNVQPPLGVSPVKAFIRSPWLVGMSIVYCICGIQGHEAFNEFRSPYTIAILSSSLATVILPSVLLFSERWSNGWMKHLSQFTICLLSFLYIIFLSASGKEWEASKLIAPYLLGILLLFWLPYIKRSTLFWSRSVQTIGALLLSLFSSLVLYGAVALALYSIETLFGVSIAEIWYLYLVFIFSGPIFISIFINHLPSIEGKVTNVYIPVAIPFVLRYILFPILLIYIVMLYSYGTLIIWEWTLPQGWVSKLINGIAVVITIFAYLSHPLRKNPGVGWVRFFYRFCVPSILPLLILYCAAIYVRIHDYGVTEPRYYLVVSAVFYTALILHLIWNKTKSLRPLFGLLIVLLIIGVYSPISSRDISVWSQTKRFYTLIERVGLPEDNTSKVVLSNKDYLQISSMLTFFEEHPLEWRPIVEELRLADIDSTFSDNNRPWELKNYYLLMGKEREEVIYKSFHNPKNVSVDVRAIDYIVPLRNRQLLHDVPFIFIENNQKGYITKIVIGSEELPLRELSEELLHHTESKPFIKQIQLKNWKVRLHISYAQLKEVDNGIVLLSLKGESYLESLEP